MKKLAAEHPLYEPLMALAELQTIAAEVGTPVTPEGSARVPLVEVTRRPELFQPRGMDEKHIEGLRRSLEGRGDLDPVTVIVVAGRVILLEGHHRFEAYRRAGFTSIPVEWFAGTLEDAVLFAGGSNSKDKLPMSSQEKQDYGWRLVLMDLYSKAKVIKAAGISDGQVANMRRIKKDLGEKAYEYPTWWKARHADQALAPTVPDEANLWMWEQAQRYADRIAKEFSSKLSRNPQVAAMTLSIYFGRKLPDVVGQLRREGLLEDAEDGGTAF